MPEKPHYETETLVRVITLSAIILLVCEHPDSLIANIVTLSGSLSHNGKEPRPELNAGLKNQIL